MSRVQLALNVADIDEAIALARRWGEGARFLAGGTDLVIQMHRRRAAPAGNRLRPAEAARNRESPRRRRRRRAPQAVMRPHTIRGARG